MEPSAVDPLCRVLVADDFPGWRSRICSLLESMPELQVVGQASDGLEAVQKAAEWKPDLILLDIGLPSMNGLEVATRIAQECACRAKILFVSENRDLDVVAEAASCPGALGYLLKTDVHTDLLPAIAAVLRGEKFMSPGLRSRFPGNLVLA
jgi:two-component system nitrate/nitrite response regulator NarL